MKGANARATRMVPRGSSTIWEIVATIEGPEGSGLRARIFGRTTGLHRVDIEVREGARTSKLHEETASGSDARNSLELIAKVWMEGYHAATERHRARRPNGRIT